MAKMLMRRDKQHNHDEQRRAREEAINATAAAAAVEANTHTTRNTEHSADGIVDHEQEISEDDELDDEADDNNGTRKRPRRTTHNTEDMHISEMEDDEASDEDIRQQRKRSHYRHNSPLPPLGDSDLSTNDSTTTAAPPLLALPSPPALSPNKLHAFGTLSPSSPLVVRTVKPSSRSRPNTSSSSVATSIAVKNSSGGGVRRPVSLIPSISSAYPLHILLAEDNHINVRLMCMLLGKLGYTKVKVALNGKEVLKALSRTKGFKHNNTTNPLSSDSEGDAAAGEGTGVAGQEEVYDCILMDCQMDVMDGMDCTNRIRQQETGTKLPSLPPHSTSTTTSTTQPPQPGHYHYICAQTANVSVQYRDMCSAAGMDAFLGNTAHTYTQRTHSLNGHTLTCSITDWLAAAPRWLVIQVSRWRWSS